jgi:hypothetical protein
MTGYGEYFYSNCFNYFGGFEEGKKHATGLINITKFNSKKIIYCGEFEELVKHGYGKIYNPDKNIFICVKFNI